jgi:P4 family phage/plasmid primase-like protien
MTPEEEKAAGCNQTAHVNLENDAPQSAKRRYLSREKSETITLPYSPDAEKGVLCSLILLPDKISEICKQRLQSEAFYVPAHKIIYESAMEFPDKSGPIDFVAFKQTLSDSNQLAEIGGIEFLHELYSFIDSASNFDYYADDVLDKWQRREDWLKGQELQKIALDNDGFNPDRNFVRDTFQLRNYSEAKCADLLLRRAQPIKCISNQWYAYEGGTWRPVSKDKFRSIAQNTMHSSVRKSQRENDILRLVEGASQIDDAELIGVYQLDGNDILVNARNGVVRVNKEGCKLEYHSPEHGFSQSLAVDYDESAKCELFIETLNQCLPCGEDRTLLQIALGNFLLPSNRHEVCLCSYGPGGTGKSTIANAVESIFEHGSDSLTNLSLRHLLDPKGYSLPRLKRAALNIGTELDSLEFEDSAAWKSLVSGESIEVRPIYGQPFSMRTTAKLWFLANGLPRFKNGSDAEVRRMRFLLFNQKPETQKTDLKEHLRKEANGIFQWILQGLVDLLDLGYVPEGGEHTRAVKETFSVRNNPVGAFVKTRCVVSPSERTPKSDLSSQFVEFLAKHGLPADLEKSFFHRLKALLPQLKDVRAGTTERVWCFSGIGIRETPEF